jgi:pSer/pThr/pTyr-binding forkhead associated (FHA) protein
VLAGAGLREGTLLNRQEVNQSLTRKRRMTLIFKPIMFLESVRAEAESLQQAIYPLQKGDQSASPDPSVFTIGREPGSDLVIPDFTISRQHALIRLRAGRILISDRESSNGTFVNGLKINSDHIEVRYGDTIGFGRVTFTVLSPEQLYSILEC